MRSVVSESREGALMVEVNRRRGFLDRRYKGSLMPRPGEEWEIRIVGENPRKTVFFWEPVERVWPPADFPDVLEVDGEIFRLSPRYYGVYEGEEVSVHIGKTLEETVIKVRAALERVREKKALRERWLPVMVKAIQDGPTSPRPEILNERDMSSLWLYRSEYLLAEKEIQARPYIVERVFVTPSGEFRASRTLYQYVSGRDLGRPAGAKGIDFTRTDPIPLPEWFNPDDYQHELLTIQAYWAWYWEEMTERELNLLAFALWKTESINNWLSFYEARVGEDGRVYDAWGLEIVVPGVDDCSE